MAKTPEERRAAQIEKDRAAFAGSLKFRQGIRDNEQAERPETVAGLKLSPVYRVNPALLTPHPANTFAPLPADELARFKDDIQARGILVPLVIVPAARNTDGTALNEGGRILAGHNRRTAALALGLKAVPVQYVDEVLTPEQERRFIVADNVLRRHLDASHKAALLAELFPEYFNGAGAPGRKKESGHGDPIKGTPEKLAHGEPIKGTPEKLVHRAPINTQEAVAKATGLSVNTIKRAKAVHTAAKKRAAAHGRPAPAPEDYKAAADEKNRERRTRPGEPVDFPGMKRADKANTGKGPRPFPMPDKGAALAAILDRAADRIGRDDPELIAVDLINEIRRAGLYGGMNRADSLGLKKK